VVGHRFRAEYYGEDGEPTTLPFWNCF